MPEIDALREGSAEAWEMVFKTLYPSLFNAAKGVIGSCPGVEAEDVALETLEELPEIIHKIASADGLAPLAISIAHNKAASAMRAYFSQKRGGGKTDSLDGLAENGEPKVDAGGQEKPLEKLEHRELAALLGELLRALPDKIRGILDLFYLEGLTQAEIAEKLGLPTGTVGSYLSRARTALRAAAETQPKILQELLGYLRCIICL